MPTGVYKRYPGIKCGFQKGHKSVKYWLGKHRPEVIEKMRKANLGKPSPFKGKTHTKKAKIKISKAHKGKSAYWNKGKNSPNWKGGITPKNKIIRRSFKFFLWREAVFKRDDYTCQKCKVKNRKGLGKTISLHPHHIKNFSEYLKLRFLVSNGITFCEKCHKKFHHIYGTKNNSQKQLKEFLG